MSEHMPAPMPHTNVRSAIQAVHHQLEQLDPTRLARKLTIFRADRKTIDRLLPEADRRIGGLAPPSVVHRVAAHNPDSFWAIARKTADGAWLGDAEGFVALLFLNQQGLTDLAGRVLNGKAPSPALLAKPGERPAAIYVWAVFAPRMLAAAVSLVLQEISVPPYDGVPLFARAMTEDGARFSEMLGFRKGVRIGPIDAPHLYVYDRSNQTENKPPAYDTYDGRADERTLSVTVARTFDDWLRIASIRSAVYIGEQECPFDEEFDGNDFSATHLIGYAGTEPAGCIRIRHFADFAKIERLAVRKEFRKTRLAFQIVKGAIEFCRAKGYRRLYGHSQCRLLNFWAHFGFNPLPGSKQFVFSDFDYTEIVLDIEPMPGAIKIGMDPYVMIRPEGRWHKPGILEHSADRPVTQPSVGARRH